MNLKAILIDVGILLAAVLLWFEYKPVPAPVKDWRPAAAAPQVAGEPKMPIKPPAVMVYAPVAKKRLNLPPAVQQDPHAHVVAATRVPADTHPETVTTVIDDQTGQTQTLVRREPLPWVALENHGSVRLDFGVKNGLTRVGRLEFREDFLQVKAMHGGIDVALDSDGTLFAGVGMAYEW